MRKRRFGRVVALVLVVSVFAVFQAGCFGKFQLTRKVYDINQSVDEKYVRSAVTWIFVIVPVYGLAALLDFILFNVIEFWSGENPVVTGPQTRVYADGGEKAVMTIAREGEATVATIERYRGTSLVSTLRIRDDGAGVVAAELVEGGRTARTAAAVRAQDGSVSVTWVSPSGTEKVRHAGSAVETYRARAVRVFGEAARTRGTAGAASLAASAWVPALPG